MIQTRSKMHDLFAAPVGKETLRAFVIFGVLVVALVGISGELVFRDLSLSMLGERLDLGRMAALEIARVVGDLGHDGTRINDDLLWENQEPLRRVIKTRLAERSFIRHVEVRDRFGVRLVYVPQAGQSRTAGGPPRPSGLPAIADRIIEVPLQQTDARPAGDVRLGIGQDELQRELLSLRRSLRIKVALSAAFALGLLVLGLFYVLHLVRKNRHLEQARQSASRASYVGLLASGLAHEIRNPLNAMNMNLQMLEEELLAQGAATGEEERELLDSTKSEIKRLERLVNNFLTYARPAEPRLEAQDLNGVVRETVKLLEADFRQYDVRLVADLEPLLPNVGLDDTQFKQALINLMVNARQVMKSGGEVMVRTRAGSKGEAVLEISDTGPGIPAETQERIFEVFYSSRGGGTGLGLPIARQIVERHGGTIELDSVQGRGTTFRIRLPRHAQRAAQPTAAL